MWISKSVRNGPPEALADCIMRRRVQSLYLMLPVYLLMIVALFTKLAFAPDLKWSTWTSWLLVTGLLLAILSKDPANRKVGPEVRRFLNDDLTQANRQAAQQTGFWVAVGLCVLFLAARLAFPLTLPQVNFAIVSGAVFGATLHFLLLERSALRG